MVLDPATFPLGDRVVRRVGFGAMQLPGPRVWGPPRDREAALAVLRAAVEAGVNHIDTAQYYGPDVSNELIHEALHPYPEDLVLVSKVGGARDAKANWIPADRPEQLRQGVEDNLRSLEVDRVDVVNLRLMGAEGPARDDAPAFEDQLAAMVELRDEGLIGAIGVSNVDADQLATARALTDIACVQNPYNLLDRSGQAVADACAEGGMAFVPFFPLGSAFARTNALLNHPVVTATAERLDCGPAQLAMAWLLDLSPNVLLIPGTSSLDHLYDNLDSADVTLDDQARSDLADLARPPV